MGRVGLYGGSFNPIHLGHLRTAIEVREQAGLEAVWLMPAHQPPHKDPARIDIAPAESRLAMVRAAIEGVDGLRAEAIELERSGPSYSIETVELLRARHPGREFALILGFDAFCEIHTWHRWKSLLADCDFIVTTRPPDAVTRGASPAQFEKLPIAVRKGFWYDERVGCYSQESGHRLEFLPVTQLDIASSALRADVARGRSIRFLVPDAVHEYIFEHGLYRAMASAAPDGAPR